METIVLKVSLVALYSVMAVRAFQSGSRIDRILGAILLVGLILLIAAPIPIAVCWLIASAAAYLISQIVTSARLLSRALPILAAALTGVLFWISEAGL